MKLTQSTRLHRAKLSFAAYFAIIFALTFTTGMAADDSVKKLASENESLRSENAELRRRFAELEARLGIPPAAAPAGQAAVKPAIAAAAAAPRPHPRPARARGRLCGPRQVGGLTGRAARAAVATARPAGRHTGHSALLAT